MPPKDKSKPKRVKKEPVEEIDLASDQYFKPSEPIVYIEIEKQCFVFKEQMDKFQNLLQSKFPNVKFHIIVNSKKLLGESAPRTGSFEIWFAQNARCKEELLWTGVHKGPPRRLKFSKNDYEDLWPQIKKILLRYYKVEEPENEDDEDA